MCRAPLNVRCHWRGTMRHPNGTQWHLLGRKASGPLRPGELPTGDWFGPGIRGPLRRWLRGPRVPRPDHAPVGSSPGRSGPEAFRPGRCHMVPLGAIWVPHGATPVAANIKRRVAPWRSLGRLGLGKLVVVKCHFRCHLVPLLSDHSPPAWHLGAPRPGGVYLRNFLRCAPPSEPLVQMRGWGGRGRQGATEGGSGRARVAPSGTHNGT